MEIACNEDCRSRVEHMHLGKYSGRIFLLLAAVFLLRTLFAVAQGGSKSTGTCLFNDHYVARHGNPQGERAPEPSSLKQMVRSTFMRS